MPKQLYWGFHDQRTRIGRMVSVLNNRIIPLLYGLYKKERAAFYDYYTNRRPGTESWSICPYIAAHRNLTVRLKDAKEFEGEMILCLALTDIFPDDIVETIYSFL